MHKHMAHLFGNYEQCPTPWKHPTIFVLPRLQSRGAVPSTRRPFQTLRRAHRRRIVPRGWAQPAHASHAHPHGKRPAAFPPSSLHSVVVCPSKRRPLPTLGRAHRRPSAQNCATPLGATRPSPPPPPPRETPYHISAAQSPFGGRFPVHEAAVAYAAPLALPPIGAESRHDTGRNPPIPATPTPTGNALPRFRRPIPIRGAFAHPQGGRSRLPTPSPRLNRRAHRASATCARPYLPEELAELQIAASLPAFLLLPPSRLDAAVRSPCRFGDERWPWLQRA